MKTILTVIGIKKYNGLFRASQRNNLVCKLLRGAFRIASYSGTSSSDSSPIEGPPPRLRRQRPSPPTTTRPSASRASRRTLSDRSIGKIKRSFKSKVLFCLGFCREMDFIIGWYYPIIKIHRWLTLTSILIRREPVKYFNGDPKRTNNFDNYLNYVKYVQFQIPTRAPVRLKTKKRRTKRKKNCFTLNFLFSFSRPHARLHVINKYCTV